MFWLSLDGKIWRMNADGSQRESLIEKHIAISFRLCGHRALFLSFEDGHFQFMRIEADSTNLKRLASRDLCASRLFAGWLSRLLP